jgi:hypothetical protein
MRLDEEGELNSMTDEQREENDAAFNDQLSMYQAVYQAEMKAYKIEIADKFREFLYNNYTIGNGEQLLQAEEDGIEDFLRENDLPPDMEIEL